MAFLRWIGAQIQALLGLVLPIFRSTPGRSGLGSVLGVTLHIAAVLVLLVLLYLLNRYFVESIRSPFHSQLLKSLWLPILFMLLYILCWLSWWLWKLLFQEEGSEYPDIDLAWAEGIQALNTAGISLLDTPLFLILGQPEDEERGLFQAAGLQLDVRQAANPGTPLRVYGNRDGIYVTCPGCSVLSGHALSLAAKSTLNESALSGSNTFEEDDDPSQTIRPNSAGAVDPKLRGVPDMAALLRQAEREGRPLNKEEKRELRRIYRRDNPNRLAMKNASWVDNQSARLRYLCRLLVRDRHPYCAVNGVLMIIPFAGMDSEEDTSLTGQACQRDLSEAIPALEVQCPLFALVGDLETAPGFMEFAQKFSDRERMGRLGRACPLFPDYREAREEWRNNPLGLGEPTKFSPPVRMVRSLAEWVCGSVVRTFVYEKFEFEEIGRTDRLPTIVANNSRLFQFFDELQQRNARLGTILASAIEVKEAGPLLFAGCYLSGTGSAPGEQAFVRGVFARLVERQSSVYWTEEAKHRETTLSYWITTGWIGLAVLVLVSLAVVSLFSRQVFG